MGGGLCPFPPIIIIPNNCNFSLGVSLWPLNNERSDEEESSTDPDPPGNQENGMYAHQEAEIEPPAGNGESEGEVSPRPLTPTAQQLPVYDEMAQQQGGALPFPVYYPPYHASYTVPPPNQYAYPLHFPDAFAGLYYEFLYANQYTFSSTGFYTHLFPYAFPFGEPYAAYHPFAQPYLNTFPEAPLYPGFQANPYEPLDGHYDMYEVGVDISHFHAMSRVGPVENIGPLPPDNCTDESSLSCFCSSRPETPEYPSTSGISSSTRRGREESSDEETAKRPRWSPESDSD